MFTHPALLRELNVVSDLLRRSGEGRLSQKIVQASDGLRKLGWTAAGMALMRDLQQGQPGLNQLSFGLEHHRCLGGELGAAQANERLEQHRRKLEQLMELPVRQTPLGLRQKSPDLFPN